MTPPASPAPMVASDGSTDPTAPSLWASALRGASCARWLGTLAPAWGLLPQTLRLASADASFRRYLRVDAHNGSSFIVMDAPPDKENCEPFVRIATLFAQVGVRVPRVFEWDRAEGFLLLEDMGQRTMIEALVPGQGQANQGLFLQAVDQLVTLQQASRPGVLPAYDAELLRRELALFPDWYLAQARASKLDQHQQAVLAQQFQLIVEHNLASPNVYVHRDFMPRNLMLPMSLDPGRDTRMGVLDFQDAVYGPITYDIASLMRDAFVSWDEEFVLDITVRYWQRARAAGLPVDPDFGAFYRAVEWMGLQRHLKVAGIFARLTLRDGKPRYLADAPRFIAYIRATAARYIELKPLLRLIDSVEGRADVQGYAFGRQ